MNRLKGTIIGAATLLLDACADARHATTPNDAVVRAATVVMRADGPYLVGASSS